MYFKNLKFYISVQKCVKNHQDYIKIFHIINITHTAF